MRIRSSGSRLSMVCLAELVICALFYGMVFVGVGMSGQGLLSGKAGSLSVKTKAALGGRPSIWFMSCCWVKGEKRVLRCAQDDSAGE